MYNRERGICIARPQLMAVAMDHRVRKDSVARCGDSVERGRRTVGE
jgi:hypothetical protein